MAFVQAGELPQTKGKSIIGYASGWDCIAQEDNDWLCRISQNQKYQIALETIATQRSEIEDTFPSVQKYLNIVNDNTQNMVKAGGSSVTTVSRNIPYFSSDMDRLIFLLENKDTFFTILWYSSEDESSAREVAAELKFTEAPLLLIVMEPNKWRYIVVSGVYSDNAVLKDHLNKSQLSSFVSRYHPTAFPLNKLKTSVLSPP